MLPALTAEMVGASKRQQIIEGAASVFTEEGYDGASMSRIAEQAGVSKGTLYNYFDSKSELFAAFVELEAADRIAWIMQPADPEPSIEISLGGLARRLIEAFLSSSFQTLHRIVISEATKFPHLARIYFESGYLRGCGELAAWLDEQASRGRLAVDDPMLAAEQFGALCRTRLWMRRCLDLHGPPSRDEIDLIADASVAMFLSSYGPARTKAPA